MLCALDDKTMEKFIFLDNGKQVKYNNCHGNSSFTYIAECCDLSHDRDKGSKIFVAISGPIDDGVFSEKVEKLLFYLTRFASVNYQQSSDV